MKIYTLCVGNGVDAGDWPELGNWCHFESMEKLIDFAETTLKLNTSVWLDMNGNHSSNVFIDPFNCLAYKDDKSGNIIARVHVHELAVDLEKARKNGVTAGMAMFAGSARLAGFGGLVKRLLEEAGINSKKELHDAGVGDFDIACIGDILPEE